MPSKKRYYCSKCHKTMDGEDFYTSNDLEKYPNDGKLDMCKKCITMHVDNWDPSTYLWILKEMDVPYVPEKWNEVMLYASRKNIKITGTTIIGRYISQMKLRQFKDYRWEHTEMLQEIKNKKVREVMERRGYTQEQIAQEIEKGRIDIVIAPPPLDPFSLDILPPKPEEIPELEEKRLEVEQQRLEEEEELLKEEEERPDPGPPPLPIKSAEELGLTEEDQTYLSLKWGARYIPEEWVKLEQFYNDMMDSYDIQTAGHKDTLKLLCKTSLIANKLLDIGDMDGYQKASKTYDSLMRSGNFTAVQNKNASGNFVDSIGELVALCEKDGYIEKYYVDTPKDKVDETLADTKRYIRELVTQETNLNDILETTLKRNEREDEALEENLEINDAVEEVERQLHDEDFMEFSDFIEEEEAKDNGT